MKMLDSASPGDIPADAEAVAGYCDGAYKWEPGDWGRFPNAKKVRIACFASTNDGEFLDVERGDATASEAPGWIEKRRAAGVFAPGIYTSFANWPNVIKAFDDAGVLHPMWWIADYDEIEDTEKFLLGEEVHGPLDTGVLAKQYLTNVHFDTSVTVANWPQ